MLNIKLIRNIINRSTLRRNIIHYWNILLEFSLVIKRNCRKTKIFTKTKTIIAIAIKKSQIPISYHFIQIIVLLSKKILKGNFSLMLPMRIITISLSTQISMMMTTCLTMSLSMTFLGRRRWRSG